ncbi:MAG: PilT protein domain protein [Candidatus Amesbacteria bacterium GW2011_GWC2_47_8]|uniref:PilT protein domain protein n=1 Tax=Candidatus Amesbacteria bacterium GW2011_GWC2_47_8 TaxID=1618367 RepID=A0A0G1VWZ8_9BACT|nr:MAG: PilT protein domain protein [Candidatus Amesbacteria bacterium GW2011_GWC2_47_8]
MNRAIVDTNALVGFLVRGESALDYGLQKYDQLVVPTQVIFEAVYILGKEYGVDRGELVDLIVKVLRQDRIESERVIVLNTLLKYRDNRNLSLVDCYLWGLAQEMKCDILTADKKLAKHLLK